MKSLSEYLLNMLCTRFYVAEKNDSYRFYQGELAKFVHDHGKANVKLSQTELDRFAGFLKIIHSRVHHMHSFFTVLDNWVRRC